MVFFISNTVKATITVALGELFFFWRLRRWWITCWKSNIFIRKNYFVFIIYAQIYLQNLKHSMRYFLRKKFTNITFFQAVKLVVPLNTATAFSQYLTFFKFFTSVGSLQYKRWIRIIKKYKQSLFFNYNVTMNKQILKSSVFFFFFLRELHFPPVYGKN